MPSPPSPDDELQVAQIRIHAETGDSNHDLELLGYAKSEDFAEKVNDIVREQLGKRSRAQVSAKPGSADILITIFVGFGVVVYFVNNISTFITSLQAIAQTLQETIDFFTRGNIRKMVTTITPNPWRDAQARERRLGTPRGWMAELIPLAIVSLLVVDFGLLLLVILLFMR